MGVRIPISTELTAQNLAKFEEKINQTSPLADKAFLRVLSVLEALNALGLYKYAAERVLQNLALTATGEDLDRIGENFGVIRKAAESAVLDITLPAADSTVIPVTNGFIGDANGVRYYPQSEVTATGGAANPTVVSEDSGIVGNLNIGDTLTLEKQIAGATNIATVTAVVNLGTEVESDDEYRLRVLDEIRTVGGGGNAVDYRRWAQLTPGVFRAYPYAGRPPELGITLPGERTVYIEADSDLDPDGIASQPLLDLAREYITTNQVTLQSNQPLGLVDSTLYVPSITRTSILTEIRGLDVSSEKKSDAKTDIKAALDVYYRSIRPYVDGVDVQIDRNDTISNLTVSTTVQEVLSLYGATASSIGFGLIPGTFLPSYTLAQGETTKAGSVTYG